MAYFRVVLLAVSFSHRITDLRQEWMRKASVDPNLQAMFRRFAQANREKNDAGGWKFFFLRRKLTQLSCLECKKRLSLVTLF